MADVAGSTPDQYALRVRTHPGVLQISASNKIRSAVEVRVSWSGRLVESYELSKNHNIIQKNLDATIDLIKKLDNNLKVGTNFFLWRNVPIRNIKDFLMRFETYDNLKSASPGNLLRFIEMNEKYKELENWSIGLISKERNSKRFSFENLNVGLIRRTQDHDKSNDDLYYIRKSHIISPGDEFIDLSPEEYKLALDRTQKIWSKDGKNNKPAYPTGEVVRNLIRKPDRPLLLLYLLDPEFANLSISLPVVGYAISFPANDRDDAVSFAVHEQLLSRFNEQDVELSMVQEDEDY
jgi:hypothetical protein